MKRIIPYALTGFCLLPVGAALLNTAWFGSPTFTAYFFYTLLASAAGILISANGLRKPGKTGRALPLPLLLFTILALYIFVHGLLRQSLTLTHYYWAASALYLLVVYGVAREVVAREPDTRLAAGSGSPWVRGTALLFAWRALSLLAFLESLVVLLQALHLAPTGNILFSCTGTWVNPNVTALYLALSLYAVFRMDRNGNAPKLVYFLGGSILIAILLLRCRSAYIVAALFLILEYGGTRSKAWISGAALFLIGSIFFLSFGSKQASSAGRIRIWTNSIGLIAQKPLFGQGFGAFEREYNLYTAIHEVPDNDHVFMPYNDFIELWVEGGLAAVLLWVAFMASLFMYVRREKKKLWLLIAFLSIQLTNFAFQAIPVFALFLVYIALEVVSRESAKESEKQPLRPGWNKRISAFTIRGPVGYAGSAALLGISLLLFFHQAILAKDFYRRNEIARTRSAPEAIGAYLELSPALKGFYAYHESFGDAYMRLRQYRPALEEYLEASEHCSLPSLLTKCGQCYQQQGQYDSSEYYYLLVQHMQPYKYEIHMQLLDLYRQKKDTAGMLREAGEIVEMPVKVESDRVTGMKRAAKRLMDAERANVQ